MSPSINELTASRVILKKGDRFQLHAQGAKILNERHGDGKFAEGDVLEYPKCDNLDVPMYRGDESIFMKKGTGGYQVDVRRDLFSEKIATK